MVKRRRAFLLVIAMLMTLMLVILGMGFLGRRGPQYAASMAHERGMQARALAEAGLEDARVKLEKDLFFPPPGDSDQFMFSYSEVVRETTGVSSDGVVVGSYTVTIDRRFETAPDPPDPRWASVYIVESLGSLGEDPLHPLATVRLRMEIDYDEGRPDPPGAPIAGTQPMRVTDVREVYRDEI